MMYSDRTDVWGCKKPESDLNQLWADEMNGKIPEGTYHKELLKQYPPPKDDEKTEEIEETSMLIVEDYLELLKPFVQQIDRLNTRIKELEEQIPYTKDEIDLLVRWKNRIKELEGFVAFLNRRAIEGRKLWWASFRNTRLPPTQEPSLEELFCWLIDQVKNLQEHVEPVVRCADCGFLIALHDEFFVSIGVDFMCSHGYAPHFLRQKHGRNFGCRSGKSA